MGLSKQEFEKYNISTEDFQKLCDLWVEFKDDLLKRSPKQDEILKGYEKIKATDRAKIKNYARSESGAYSKEELKKIEAKENRGVIMVLLIIIGLFVGYNAFSGVSACDCANAYDGDMNPGNKEYSMAQINKGTLPQKHVNEWVEFGRECCLEFGNPNDLELELMKGARTIGDMYIFDRAVRNAKKKCED